MSDGGRASSSLNAEIRILQEAVERLGGKVETWEETLAAWPPAVAERVAGALRTAQEQHTAAQEQHEAQAKERWRKVAERLLVALDARAEEIQKQRQSLTGVTESLERVSRGVEDAIAPWVMGWSRGLLKVVAMTVGVTVGVSLLLLAPFWWTGPPATCRAELEACAAERTNCRQWWGVLTEAERRELQARLTTQTQETGQ